MHIVRIYIYYTYAVFFKDSTFLCRSIYGPIMYGIYMEATLKRKPGIRFELDIWSQSLAFPQARRNRIGSASYSVLLSCHGFAACIPAKTIPQNQTLDDGVLLLVPLEQLQGQCTVSPWAVALALDAWSQSLSEGRASWNQIVTCGRWPPSDVFLFVSMSNHLCTCSKAFPNPSFFFVDTWIILGMWSDWTMVLLPVFPSRSPNFFLQIQRFFSHGVIFEPRFDLLDTILGYLGRVIVEASWTFFRNFDA